MPFCPQCGVANPDNARFCDQCGAQLIPVPAAPPQAPTPVPVTPPEAGGSTVGAGLTTCPQCGTGVIPGEAFCDNCGAPLFNRPAVSPPPGVGSPFPGVPPQPFYPPPQPATIQIPAPARPTPVPPVPPSPVRSSLAGVRLRLENGTVLSLPATGQATVGRADPVSNFYPDIDLTTHGGLERGVGRRHGRFLVQQGQVYYEDLDSTNGSFRNNSKIPPRQPQPIQHGDELRLGALKLTVELP
ncbi:zinc-ribbon domain-containing protein [Chloroflexus sp.]|uniref:zinc-ribbon domain-containing protein n=1 Tax=Chloroflexus sp. TaxID=1904827 RepID=UPI00404A12DF